LLARVIDKIRYPFQWVSADELSWTANIDDDERTEELSTVTTFEKVLSDKENGDTIKHEKLYINKTKG